MQSLFKRFIASTAATSIAVAPMQGRANPLGGQVTAGSASIQGQGTSSVIVNQSSNRAIVDWRSFNLAPTDTTQFVQPNSSAVILNRVTGGLGASQIDGTIKANGGVFIVNPDGILFGSTSKVNVGSFLATTHDIANSDFLAGNYKFSIFGNPSASIVNQGTITAAQGGFAALVAPGVRNDGVITARLGTVSLASANVFTLDLYGDSLIKLQPSDAIASEVKDVATGETLTSLVQNTGKLKANGGTVSLTAVSAKKIVDSVINSSGVIEADTVGTKNGLVIFGAATADTKITNTPTQTVKVSGKISAAGKKAGTTGGKIQITGENIVLASAKLNASGQAGGGKILVGGDFKGGNPNALAVTNYGQSFESDPVPNASAVSVDAASRLNASAIKSGNGGKIVVWSNDTTIFAGSALATGGNTNGNGGFVETSGQFLNINGASVTTAAPKGSAGHWLLDPDDFTVDSSNVGDVNAALANGDVIIATTAAGTGGNGDIFINAPISWSANTLLTLDAYRSIQVNSNISLAGDHAGLNITYNDGGTGGSLSTAAGASITLSGSAPLLAINGNVYNLIRTASDLQAIQSQNTPGFFALANDIDLSSISNFAPIGGTGTSQSFYGTFEGLGHTISNLKVSVTDNDNGGYIGLFGSLYLYSVVENLNISGGSVNADGQGALTVGVIAGFSAGRITNVSSSVIVNTLNAPYSYAGGLVGANNGVIEYSHSDGDVSGVVAGGLIGRQAGTVQSSYATGNVFGISLGGGLSGLNYGLHGPDYITDSYSTGTVSGGDGAIVGGLLGFNEYGFIRNSYATGNVYAGVNAIGGGLVGRNWYVIDNSFSTGNVTVGSSPYNVGTLIGDNSYTGNPTYVNNDIGTGRVTVSGSAYTASSSGFTPAASINDVTNQWDFKNIWNQPSSGYPLLQAFRIASTAQLPPTSGSGSGTGSGNSGSSSDGSSTPASSGTSIGESGANSGPPSAPSSSTTSNIGDNAGSTGTTVKDASKSDASSLFNIVQNNYFNNGNLYFGLVQFENSWSAASLSKTGLTNGVDLSIQASLLRASSNYRLPDTNINATTQIDIITATGAAKFSTEGKNVEVALEGDVSVVKAKIEDTFDIAGYTVVLGGIGSVGLGGSLQVIDDSKNKHYKFKGSGAFGPGVGISVDIKRIDR
jgi:filamentous hemagglutinin family protein